MHAGLFLLALCGGAPFLPKIISIAKGNQTHSITLMVLLMAISVAYIPAILPMVVPGTTIYPLKVVLPQVFLLLLPLFIGLQVNRRWPQFAARAKSIAAKATAVSLVVVAALSLWRDLQIFKAAYGTGLYVFFTLLIGGSISLGYLFGGPNREDKVAMSIGSGARNITAALLVAITNFPDRNVAAVVIIGSLVECVMLVTAAKIFGRAQTS
jgi:BASS family bile acid:Na+ symporter